MYNRDYKTFYMSGLPSFEVEWKDGGTTIYGCGRYGYDESICELLFVSVLPVPRDITWEQLNKQLQYQ